MLTSVEVLVRVCYLDAGLIMRYKAQEKVIDYDVVVLVFSEKTRETDLLFYDSEYPESFLVELEERIEEGYHPISVEFCESEEKQFQCIELYFLESEPSIEDQIIVNSQFDSNPLEALMLI